MTKVPAQKPDSLPSAQDIRALEEQTRTWKELAAQAVAFSDRVLQLIADHERLKGQLAAAQRVKGWRDVIDRVRESDPHLGEVLARAHVRSYSPDEVTLDAEVEDHALIKLNARRISSFCLQVLGVKSKIKVFRVKT
jgi:hypothetical protein